MVELFNDYRCVQQINHVNTPPDSSCDPLDVPPKFRLNYSLATIKLLKPAPSQTATRLLQTQLGSTANSIHK